MKERFVIIRVRESTRARLKAKAAKKRAAIYDIADEGSKLVKV